MKDRIQQIMIHEGMNQQEFSRATGIAPASLSSIFTGRTSPTLKHAEALHRHFPNLNMSWLLFGDGEMMVSEDGTADAMSHDLFSGAGIGDGALSGEDAQHPSQDIPSAGMMAGLAGAPAYPTGEVGVPVGGQVPNPYMQQIPLEYLKKLDIKPRRISEIRIFFDDGTFEVFKGNI